MFTKKKIEQKQNKTQTNKRDKNLTNVMFTYNFGCYFFRALPKPANKPTFPNPFSKNFLVLKIL